MKPRKEGPSIAELAEDARRRDREIAAIIIANPAKYPHGCGLNEWARLVLAKPAPPAVKRGEQHSMFQMEETE